MNIYNIDQFQKNEYSWNPVAKRRAGNYFIKLGVGVALIFALYGLLGYFLFVTHAFVTQTLWGYGASKVAENRHEKCHRMKSMIMRCIFITDMEERILCSVTFIW